jgi:hypothetical protein
MAQALGVPPAEAAALVAEARRLAPAPRRRRPQTTQQ